MNRKGFLFPVFFLVSFFPSTGQNNIPDSISYPTYMEMSMGDSVTRWLEQRVENAKKGIKEKVRMPFVVRTLAWGCRCPDNYIGVSPNLGDGPWVFPLKPKKFPESDTIGYSLVVTGYFTGKMRTLDLRMENGGPEEWLYVMPEFKITGWTSNKKEYDVEAPRVIGK